MRSSRSSRAAAALMALLAAPAPPAAAQALPAATASSPGLAMPAPLAVSAARRRRPPRTASRRRPRRPTRAEREAARRRREAEKRRREAARREAERRQRAALEKAWRPAKGCYQSGTVFDQPRVLDDDPIDVPSSARGGALKAALLLYEAHVDKSGHLYSLRTLRPLPKEHPWPVLHAAVVASLRGWKWSKTKVAGKAIAVCFPLTLNLDLR